MTDEEIKDTFLYKDCYERVKRFPELAGDLVYHLRDAFEGYERDDRKWHTDLSNAFIWKASPQGHNFWESIRHGNLPKEYR